MTKTDPTTVERIIAEVAATEIMPRFRKLLAGDIEMKAVNDPVTVADKAAEAALTARLSDHLPGSVVVGEEGFFRDPLILSRLSGKHDVWVIDPIDGTRQFIEGNARFGVMVALQRGGHTVASWIHDPNSGDTLAAEQGGGVWLHKKDGALGKMHLAPEGGAAKKVGLIGSKHKKFLMIPEIASVLGDLPPLAVGYTAAASYSQMFTGERLYADSAEPRAGFVIGYRTARPWDHLPGLFMLREAGGYNSDWFGNPYDYINHGNGILVAGEDSVRKQVLSVMKDAFRSPDLR